jgi:hypothetical protein
LEKPFPSTIIFIGSIHSPSLVASSVLHLPSIISNKQNKPQSNNSIGQVYPMVDEDGIAARTLVQSQETTSMVMTMLGCD